MKRRLSSWATVALLGLTGCAADSDPFLIGVALSQEYYPGAILACQEINHRGGVAGHRLEIIGHDWTDINIYDHRDAHLWARRFSERAQVISVIGHSDSSSTLATAPQYNRLGLPHVVTMATNPAIRAIGPWTYQICVTDEHQGTRLAEHAHHAWSKRRFALFYVDDDYGRQLAEVFSRRLAEYGGEIVTAVPHRNDFGPEDRRLCTLSLDRLADAGFSAEEDCFAFLSRRMATEWLLAAIADRPRLTRSVIASEAAAGSRVAAIAHRLGFDYRAPLFFIPAHANPEAEAFSREFKRQWGFEPDYGAALAYDAVHLIAQCVRQGGATRAGVRRSLEQIAGAGTRLEGVAGAYTLRPDRGADRDLVLGRVREGRFVPMGGEPPPPS